MRLSPGREMPQLTLLLYALQMDKVQLRACLKKRETGPFE
jgi:hypothetical protein